MTVVLIRRSFILSQIKCHRNNATELLVLVLSSIILNSPGCGLLRCMTATIWFSALSIFKHFTLVD